MDEGAGQLSSCLSKVLQTSHLAVPSALTLSPALSLSLNDLIFLLGFSDHLYMLRTGAGQFFTFPIETLWEFRPTVHLLPAPLESSLPPSLCFSFSLSVSLFLPSSFPLSPFPAIPQLFFSVSPFLYCSQNCSKISPRFPKKGRQTISLTLKYITDNS